MALPGLFVSPDSDIVVDRKSTAFRLGARNARRRRGGMRFDGAGARFKPSRDDGALSMKRFAFTLAALAALAAPAFAQDDQRDVCSNRDDNYTTELQLRACSAIIRSSTEMTRGLAGAYNSRGNAYREQGNFANALVDYNSAIRIDSTFANAYNNRGITHRARGELDAAMEDYNRALQLNPNFSNAYNNRGTAHADRGELEQAIADYDQAIRLRPDFASAYNNRGNAYRAQGRYAEALADYNRAIEINPRYATAFNNRGKTYRAMGDLTRAIADFDEAARLDPDNPNFAAYGL